MKKLSLALLAIFSLSIISSAFAEEMKAGMPNPASVNCTEKWWTAKAMNGKDWAYAFCVFDNWSSCEEWALFRGECKNEWDFINPTLYAELLKQESKVIASLSWISTDVLKTASENIEGLIENTKLLRITQEGQKMRITQLAFLRYVFTIELANR